MKAASAKVDDEEIAFRSIVPADTITDHWSTNSRTCVQGNFDRIREYVASETSELVSQTKADLISKVSRATALMSKEPLSFVCKEFDSIVALKEATKSLWVEPVTQVKEWVRAFQNLQRSQESYKGVCHALGKPVEAVAGCEPLEQMFDCITALQVWTRPLGEGETLDKLCQTLYRTVKLSCLTNTLLQAVESNIEPATRAALIAKVAENHAKGAVRLI